MVVLMEDLVTSSNDVTILPEMHFYKTNIQLP